MDIVIHRKPRPNEKFVSLFVYSVRTKKHPGWWKHYDCEYFPARKLFGIKRSTILCHVIESLYGAIHEIPDCDDCELVEAPVNYRQMETEDRD